MLNNLLKTSSLTGNNLLIIIIKNKGKYLINHQCRYSSVFSVTTIFVKYSSLIIDTWWGPDSPPIQDTICEGEG